MDCDRVGADGEIRTPDRLFSKPRGLCAVRPNSGALTQQAKLSGLLPPIRVPMKAPTLVVPRVGGDPPVRAGIEHPDRDGHRTRRFDHAATVPALPHRVLPAIPGRSPLGRTPNRGLDDPGIDSGAELVGTERARRSLRPPGRLPCRRCSHLRGVRLTPNTDLLHLPVGAPATKEPAEPLDPL